MRTQADLDLTEAPLHTANAEPRSMGLHGMKGNKRVEGSLGEIQVAIWLAPTGQLGRMARSDVEGTPMTMAPPAPACGHCTVLKRLTLFAFAMQGRRGDILSRFCTDHCALMLLRSLNAAAAHCPAGAQGTASKP